MVPGPSALVGQALAMAKPCLVKYWAIYSLAFPPLIGLLVSVTLATANLLVNPNYML